MKSNDLYKYENPTLPTSTIVECSQIVAYTNTLNDPQWSLYTLDGTLVYTSDHINEWYTWILDFSTVTTIQNGTILRLKAFDDGTRRTLTSSVLLKYTPNSNTAYFHTGPIHNASIGEIDFTGIIESSSKPPVLKCSKIYAYNDSRMLTKWSFRINHEVIFLSGRCRMGHGITFDLSELSISPGTQFIFHADCIGGTDSEAYVMFEYDPLSDNFVDLQLYGNAMHTCICYQGSLTS